jgi:ferredoxin
MCELMAGHLFKVGPSGIAEPVNAELTSQDEIDAATDAMNGCPSGAIVVHVS